MASNSHPDRRRFLGYSGAALASGAIFGACSSDGGMDAAVSSPDGAAVSAPGAPSVQFRAARQLGAIAPPSSAGLVAALDVQRPDRATLVDTLRTLSEEIEHLMSGASYEPRAGGFPPADTGILGPDELDPALHVVVGVGASLFDDRFGLGDRMPSELQPMPKFANDYLVRDEQSHGDLSLVIGGSSQESVVHAFRQLLRVTRGALVPRWVKQGFNNIDPSAGPGEAAGRNLMGFKDGTANPPADDETLMDQVVWIGADEGQPEWAVGGTYQALRVIRMQVEFWDRTRLSEQEAIFARHRDTGAPLGQDLETDEPDFGGDLSSHIARANPRTPGSDENLIVRRGFNYSTGLDGNDQLDQGLIFTCYQQSLETGFITVQRRLDGEALEEYIRPLGGGFFFVLPGPGPEGFLGESLVA